MPDPTSVILLDFPEAFETERLVVRAPRWGDGAAMHEAIAESIDELRPWMPWAQQVPTLEGSEANCRHARLRFLARSDLRFHLVLAATDELIGSSGLHRIDWDVRRFEIGYWVRTGFGGRGYVTEAVNGLTRFALERLGARRLEIRCDARNLRSSRVAERAGFTLEGVLRSERLAVDGRPSDTMVYAKVRGQEL